MVPIDEAIAHEFMGRGDGFRADMLIKAIIAPDTRQIGCQITLVTAYRRPPWNRVARLVGAGLSGKAGPPDLRLRKPLLYLLSYGG